MCCLLALSNKETPVCWERVVVVVVVSAHAELGEHLRPDDKSDLSFAIDSKNSVVSSPIRTIESVLEKATDKRVRLSSRSTLLSRPLSRRYCRTFQIATWDTGARDALERAPQRALVACDPTTGTRFGFSSRISRAFGLCDRFGNDR